MVKRIDEMVEKACSGGITERWLDYMREHPDQYKEQLEEHKDLIERVDKRREEEKKRAETIRKRTKIPMDDLAKWSAKR